MGRTDHRWIVVLTVVGVAAGIFVADSSAGERMVLRSVLHQIEPPLPPPPPIPPQDAGGGAPCPSREELEAGLKPISALTASILAPAGEMPLNCSHDVFGQNSMPGSNDIGTRAWPMAPYYWTAPGLCHRPLYFEEPGLERHGHSMCPALQPLISGAHFVTTVPTLPYQMVAYGHRQCIYTLGHFRPGSPAPALHYRLPVRLDAAVVQGAVVTGLVFLIP